MKKLVLFLSLVLVSGFAFAQYSKFEEAGRKYAEINVDVCASAGESFIGMNDILKKELVIDFSKIADKMGDNGVTFSAKVDPTVGFYFGQRCDWGFGFDFGLDLNLRLSTGKGIFDYLGYGSTDGGFSSDAAIGAEAFYMLRAPVNFKIDIYRFKVVPIVFTPLFYIPHSIVNFNVKNNYVDSESGDRYLLYTDMTAEIPFYSNFGVHKDSYGKYEFKNLDNAYSPDIFGNSGFALGLSVESPVTYNLDVGLYTDIPIVPGKLNYKTPAQIKALAKYKSFDWGSDDSDESSEDSDDDSFESDFDFSFGETTDAEYRILVPFRLGGNVEWRPFGNWYVMSGMLGIAARNPFSKDFDAKADFFVEFDGSIAMYCFNHYGPGFKINLGYMDQIWQTSFKLDLNLRVLDIYAQVGLSSPGFIEMFNISGLDARVGFSIGF